MKPKGRVVTPTVNKVDVVLPYHDLYLKWLDNCIQTLQSQLNCIPIIHLISDGCSFSKEVQDDYPELNHYHHDESVGPYECMNKVFKWLTCEYIAIADCDDYYLPNRFVNVGGDIYSGTMINFIDHADREDKGRVAYQKKNPLFKPGAIWDNSPGGFVVNPSCCIRRSYYEKVGGFENVRCSGDIEFGARSHFKGADFIHDTLVVGARRLHNASLISGDIGLKSKTRQDYHDKIKLRIKEGYTGRYGDLSETNPTKKIQ